MRRLTPTQTVLFAAILTLALLNYVFGVPAILNGLIWVALGAVVGWLGSLVHGEETRQGILFEILMGAVGALAGLPLFGAPMSGGPFEQFLAAVVGSVLAVAVAGVALGSRPWRSSLLEAEPGR